MTRREWFEALFKIWKENRDKPGWADIYELHDEEDRRYFMSLDELDGR